MMGYYCSYCQKRADDIRLVRFRLTGKATLYQQAVVEICGQCRKDKRGRWKYAEYPSK